MNSSTRSTETRTKTSAPIRIVIVDDHPVVRTGLRGMLNEDARFDVVAEAADGAHGIVAVRHHEPNVVLMDLRMPNMDGVSAIEHLTLHYPAVHALVLTTYDTDAEILRAIEAGAIGYLLKDAPSDELFRAIEYAAAGKTWLTPAVATRMLNRVRLPPEDSLSNREVEVLRHVARGESNRQIATDLFISEATIKTHLVHIYRKLAVEGRTAAVTVALERGLISLRNDSTPA